MLAVRPEARLSRTQPILHHASCWRLRGGDSGAIALVTPMTAWETTVNVVLLLLTPDKSSCPWRMRHPSCFLAVQPSYSSVGVVILESPVSRGLHSNVKEWLLRFLWRVYWTSSLQLTRLRHGPFLCIYLSVFPWLVCSSSKHKDAPRVGYGRKVKVKCNLHRLFYRANYRIAGACVRCCVDGRPCERWVLHWPMRLSISP